MYLKKIIHYKKKEIENSKKLFPMDEYMYNLELHPPDIRGFKESLMQDDVVNIIAEVKQASPSKGIICQKFSPVQIAKEYSIAGAKAISVLTEKKFFQGDRSYIKKIKKHVDLPLLQKDFIIDEYQVYESLFLHADALLLIARILTLGKLTSFIKLATSYNLSCLVEVHDEDDLQKALGANAEIIGVNNRNLETFQVDIQNTLNLLDKIPKDKIIVSESGLSDYATIKQLNDAGVHAFLIGESLLVADNRKQKMKELMGIK